MDIRIFSSSSRVAMNYKALPKFGPHQSFTWLKSLDLKPSNNYSKLNFIKDCGRLSQVYLPVIGLHFGLKRLVHSSDFGLQSYWANIFTITYSIYVTVISIHLASPLTVLSQNGRQERLNKLTNLKSDYKFMVRNQTINKSTRPRGCPPLPTKS